jgi:hypothetical protein
MKKNPEYNKSSRFLDKVISLSVPESTLEISDDKKVDILLEIYNNTRISSGEVSNKIYNIIIWSTGLFFGLVALFVQYFQDIKDTRYILLLSTIFLILITQIYIHNLVGMRESSGKVIVQIEAVLRLCENDVYLKGQPFFGYSGKWVSDPSVKLLRILQFLAGLFASLFLIVYKG